jgi:hypothetical protein
MRVDHRANVRTVAIHLQVHLEFGRRVALAVELSPVEIHDAHHLWRHESLRHAFRRRYDPSTIEPHSDIPVVARNVAPCVQTTADFTDVGADGSVGGRH